MKKVLILLILAICSVSLFGQIEPIQMQGNPYKGGILRSMVKYYDEWQGDTMYYYQHDTIPQDSLFVRNDTIFLKNGSGFAVLPDVDLSGYAEIADSSQWTLSGTNLFPKSLSANVGIGLNNPAQQLELTGSFRTPATTSSTTGVWYKGTAPFIHNFGTGNTFTGVNSGNFTLSGSYNNGQGLNTLYSLTNGNYNNAQGYASLYANTTGSSNTAQGSSALNANIDGNHNTAQGYIALNKNTSGGGNTGAGSLALENNTTGSYNVCSGYAALRHLVGSSTIGIGAFAGYNISSSTGSIFIGRHAGYQSGSLAAGAYNTVIGYDAGRALGSGANNILLGYDVELAAPNTSNQLNIGNAIYATGLGTGSTPSASAAVGIGTSTPAAQLHTTGTVRLAGAGTPGAGKVLTSDADGDATWETPAAGGDTQDLSIDSLGRRFQISLVDGGSVKFLDTNSGGTVTSIASGNGMNFSTITSTGTVTMGTPSSLSSITTNAVTSTSHTHAIDTSSTKGIATQHDLLSKLGTTLTSGNIFVGNASNIATGVTMSGDATMSNAGALSIGANKITEAMLKAVDTPNDEEYLTYETTTGDFEWQAFSGLTGSGAANRMAYFTGASTLKGSTLITNDSTTITSMLNIMHTSASGINGLRLFTTNSTPAGSNLRWQLANVSGNLVFNGANTSSLFKIQNSGGTDKFIFDPNNNKIGVYNGTGIDYGNDATGQTTKYLGYDNANNRVAWLVPTATIDQKFAKFWRSTAYNVNHTSNKALPLFKYNDTSNPPNPIYNFEGFTMALGDTTLQVPAAGYYELSLNMKAATTAETGSSSLQFQYFIGDSSPTGCYLGYQTLTSPNASAEQITYNTIVYIPAPLSSNKLRIKVASTVSGAVYSVISAVDFTIKRIE